VHRQQQRAHRPPVVDGIVGLLAVRDLGGEAARRVLRAGDEVDANVLGQRRSDLPSGVVCMSAATRPVLENARYGRPRPKVFYTNAGDTGHRPRRRAHTHDAGRQVRSPAARERSRLLHRRHAALAGAFPAEISNGQQPDKSHRLLVGDARAAAGDAQMGEGRRGAAAKLYPRLQDHTLVPAGSIAFRDSRRRLAARADRRRPHRQP